MLYRHSRSSFLGRWVLAFVFAFAVAVPRVEASVTPLLTYQARLWSSSGAPVADGSYNMIFSLYTASSGGTPIWTAAGLVGSPTLMPVNVTAGGFTVVLGDMGQNSLAGIDWDRTLYLGITIGGTDSEMTPRRRLTSVPHAFQADNATQLQGMYASGTAASGQSLFTIHQTDTSAASDVRSALDVRSEGTSNAFDYLFRGINSDSSVVFSVDRRGNTTSTGAWFVDAQNASSTVLGNVLLGTSTRSVALPPLFGMDGNDVLVGGELGVASGVHAVTGLYVGAGNTFYGSSGLSAANSFSVRGSGIVLNANGGSITPDADLNASLGTQANRFNAYFGNATATNLVALGGGAATSAVKAINTADPSGGSAWGVYTNRLLVGENADATGTASYVGVFAYDSGNSHNGICLDDLNTAAGCTDFSGLSPYSIVADNAIGASAFDLAERYAITGSSEPGDLLVLDPDQPMQMRVSPGIPYDDRISGVVSTRPGFILGVGGSASVGLSGRVPLKVTVANGVIRPGDALTSSDRPGIAMKATRAGKIIGRALQSADADGVVEVFLQPGFDASPLLQADGSLTVIAQDTGLQARSPATAEAPAQPSRSLAFRGSAWDGSRAVASEFRMFNDVRSATGSLLTVQYGSASSSLFALSRDGSLDLAGDLALAGKLYPSARGRSQHDKYVFVDDTDPDAQYVSTNANGWQSMAGYDYAERYPSPDALEPGDLVVVHRSRRVYVQRSLNDRDMLVGIVSTRPGFVAGRPEDDVYPIALAGRVPTKVSTMNGAIEAGDPLAASSIPGVAVKATKPGPIVGLALEPYAGSDIGKVEVFVNPTWWGGSAAAASARAGSLKSTKGFAEISVGRKRVHVDLDGFIRYPHLQVTPYTQTESGWWIEHVGPKGFDIVLGGVVGTSVRFAWSAAEVADDERLSLSSGRVFAIDPVSGQIDFPPGVSEDDPPGVVSAPVAPPTETLPEAPTTTAVSPDLPGGSVEPPDDGAASSTVTMVTSTEPAVEAEVPSTTEPVLSNP